MKSPGNLHKFQHGAFVVIGVFLRTLSVVELWLYLMNEAGCQLTFVCWFFAKLERLRRKHQPRIMGHYPQTMNLIHVDGQAIFILNCAGLELTIEEAGRGAGVTKVTGFL